MSDLVEKGMRHFATYQRHSVIIVGFHDPSNTVYLLNPKMMPSDEEREIVRIAAGPTAQASDSLAMVLKDITHGKSGRPWLEHIWNNRNWMGTTFPDNLSDMNQDQKNFFKGFGRSLNETTAKVEETHHSLRVADPVAPVVAVAPVAVAPVAEPPMAAYDADDGDDEAAELLDESTNNGSSERVERKLDEMVQALHMLARAMKDQTTEVNRVLKRIPKSPGRPKNDDKAKKVVTGRPTPVEIVAPTVV